MVHRHPAAMKHARRMAQWQRGMTRASSRGTVRHEAAGLEGRDGRDVQHGNSGEGKQWCA